MTKLTRRNTKEVLCQWLECNLHCAGETQLGTEDQPSTSHPQRQLQSIVHPMQRKESPCSCSGISPGLLTSWRSCQTWVRWSCYYDAINQPRSKPIHTHSHWRQLSGLASSKQIPQSSTRVHSWHQQWSPSSEYQHWRGCCRMLFWTHSHLPSNKCFWSLSWSWPPWAARLCPR